MKFKRIYRCKARPRNLRPLASGLSGPLLTALSGVIGTAATSASAAIWDSSLDCVTGDDGFDVAMTSSVTSSFSSSSSVTGLLTDKIYSGSITVSSYILSEQKVSIWEKSKYSKRMKKNTTYPNIKYTI